jgi:antitoxin ParD1/3/4
MNVSLTPTLQKFVAEKVKTGRYQSASEVVREALRLLEEQDRLHRIRITELRKGLALGMEQIKRGEVVDGDEVFRRLRQKVRTSSRKKA